MVRVSCQLDTSEFDRAFARYVKVSKRSLAEIVNKKACAVAIGALRNTKRADRNRIAATLGNFVPAPYTNKQGQARTRRQVVLVQAKEHEAPLAAIIINARRGRAGEKGLEGPEMAKAVRKMLGARIRSIGFLASGWVDAIRKTLAALKDKAGLPRQDRKVREAGQPKGGAAPARESWNPAALIWNSISKHEEQTAPHIQAGLQKALDAEARSMDEYVERKMQDNAKAFR